MPEFLRCVHPATKIRFMIRQEMPNCDTHAKAGLEEFFDGDHSISVDVEFLYFVKLNRLRMSYKIRIKRIVFREIRTAKILSA